MNIDFHSLIEAAILAPTPDNNQPWRFADQDERLLVYLDPSRTLPSDVNCMFDLVGLGSAVENACIAARQAGLTPSVEVTDCPAEALKDPARPVASISFTPGGQPDPLYAYLTTRSTNRKLYSTRPVPAEALAQMTEAAKRWDSVRVDWVTDRRQISELARLVAAADLIRFQYEPFHNELFRQLRFTPQEAEQTRDGLDVRTLELPPGAAWLFHKLKPWKRMRMVHRLGLGRLLTMPSALAVRRSGAIGLLSVHEPKVESFLQGGMALERLWLTATPLGLALQPLGSLPIFLAHWQQLGGARLCATHATRVKCLSEKVRSLLPDLSGGVSQIVFRIGQSTLARFRSLRRSALECRL